MSDFKIASREQLTKALTVDTEVLELPELGEGVAVKVKGYTVGDTANIHKASVARTADGREIYDQGNDILFSVFYALADPTLDMSTDGEWVKSWPSGIAQKIINKALALTRKSSGDYEDLKHTLRTNDYLRRIWSIGVKLGYLPQQIEEMPESEFIKVLALQDIEYEKEVEAMDRLSSR